MIDHKITSNSKNDSLNSVIFLLLICLISAFRIYVIQKNIWPINGDEAQYWDWSRKLAFGYYSKPPMLAWFIAISEKIFGHSSLGLRFFSPILHALTSVFIYLIARKLWNSTVAFWSGLLYITIPGVTFSSTIISTDVPTLFFWVVALWCLVYALEKNKLRWWFGLGTAMAFALLSKYVAIFFLISTLIYLALSSQHSRQLKNPRLYLALIWCFILVLPNIMWNAQHHFVSFRAVNDNANLSHVNFQLKNIINFVGAQFIIFNPILFVGLLYIFIKPKWIFEDERKKLLINFVWPVLLVMTVEAALSRAHGNWAVTAYVAAIILVTSFAIERSKIIWLKIIVITNIFALVLFLWVAPIINFVGIKLSPTMNAINWDSIGKQVSQLQMKYPNALWLTDNRILLTETMYFSRPFVKEIYEWNASCQIKDQYQLETDLSKQVGKDFIIVTFTDNPRHILSRFEKVDLMKTYVLQSLSVNQQKMIYVYQGHKFLGYDSECRLD